MLRHGTNSTGARSKSHSRTHLASSHARLTTAQRCGTRRRGPRVKNNIMLLFAEVLVIDAMQRRLHGPRCAFPPARRTDAMQQSPGDNRATMETTRRENPMTRSALFVAAVAAGLGLASPSFAQNTVYMPIVVELSGGGAVSGTNFRDGLLMAIDEVNAKGGILGRKIDTPVSDTQSDASVSRAQIQKVLDNKPYVIFGPVYSGSVLVDMQLTQAARNSGNRRRRSSWRSPRRATPTCSAPRSASSSACRRSANIIRDDRQGEDRRRAVGEQRLSARAGAIVSSRKWPRVISRSSADIPSEAGQADFSADVVKLKAANADVIFVYLQRRRERPLPEGSREARHQNAADR